MKARFLLFCVAVALLTGCGRPVLREKGWNPVVREALTALIREADPEQHPYAVFDFDNTTLIGDIEVQTFRYQIEQLRFRIAPEVFYRTLLENIPRIDAPLAGVEATSARMLATDLFNDYLYLYAHYIGPDGQDPLEEVRRTPAYLDFRAKLWALSAGADGAFGYEVGCLWILRMFDGMDRKEIAALAREAADESFAEERIRDEVWTSPDLGEAGVVSVTVSRGLGLTPEMRELYRALQEAGISVYICSASMEEVVAAVACDPAYGLDVPREQVFGIRIEGGKYLPGYPHTHHEGKVEAIRRLIAPRHGGADPVLVAGDSEGDRDMLTAFPGMRVGLLVNVGRDDPFGQFVAEARPPYVVQGRDRARKQFIDSDKSK